ncbi:MAG: 16S rRNA (guanine(527)-N(7))-methyltransferase RsmG, partial [Oscillospiraceae bacterium]
MYNRNLLKNQANFHSIEISEQQLDKFEVYSELLCEWNKKINLTKITEPDEIAIKHFLDSIMPLKYIQLEKCSKVADIGSGAGFPMIPIEIMRPDLHVTMIDSLNKRVQFLNLASEHLMLNSRAIHMRAEDVGNAKAVNNLRDTFDIVFARAVASLNILCEYSLPLIKTNGQFVALKGFDCDEEIEKAKTTINLLG